MADIHETIADIIAEIRALSNPISDGIIAINGRIIADRIEAAWKRERQNYDAKIADLQLRVKLWTDRSAELVKKCDEQYAKLKQVGNSAKLRDALVQVQKKINYLIGNLTVPNSLVANRMEFNGIINAALAAPPRNCDRFATVDEARKAHEAICEKYGKCHNGCPLNNEEHYSAFDCFEAWLFAPAKVTEGGAK